MEALALLNSFDPVEAFDVAATLAAIFLCAALFFTKNANYGLLCAMEFLVSNYAGALSFYLISNYGYNGGLYFIITYALKDFLFICLLSRIYTPSKFWFMLALFVSMIAYWSILTAVHFGYYIAYDIRPLVMRCVIVVQLCSMAFTLVKGDDDNDDNGTVRRRKRTDSRVSYFYRLGKI